MDPILSPLYCTVKLFFYCYLGEKLADRSTHLIKQRKLLKHGQISYLVLCSQSKLVRVLVFRVPEGSQRQPKARFLMCYIEQIDDLKPSQDAESEQAREECDRNC